MTIDPVTNAYFPATSEPYDDGMARGLEHAKGIIQRRAYCEARDTTSRDLVRRIIADIDAAIAGARSE